jgi:hypothetical protein
MSNTKLNEIDQAWVDALRSGNHKQGVDGKLCEIVGGEKRECCLGVLINIRQDPSVKIEINNDIYIYKEDDGLDRFGTLPRKFLVNSGLFQESGRFRPNWIITTSADSSLASLNDNGCSFVQIADLIEAFPWLVFKHYDEPDGVEFDLPASFGGGKLIKPF